MARRGGRWPFGGAWGAALRAGYLAARSPEKHPLAGRAYAIIARLALRRGDLPLINSLVDAYNLVSVRSLCSLGAHDLDKMRYGILQARRGGLTKKDVANTRTWPQMKKLLGA